MKGEIGVRIYRRFTPFAGVETDTQIAQNSQLLTNESFAEKMMLRLIIEQFKNEHHIPLNADSSKFIKNLVMKEYLAEYHGQQPA